LFGGALRQESLVKRTAFWVSFFLLMRLVFLRQFHQESIQAPRRCGVMLVCAAEVHIEAQPFLAGILVLMSHTLTNQKFATTISNSLWNNQHKYPQGYRELCKIAFSPNLIVAPKILSSEYQLYACGKIFLAP
jgi:hypothetical protein